MFIKYPSIENTYRKKELERWIRLYPELETVPYVITEKLHGTNFQIIFDEDKYGNEIMLASKRRVLGDTNSHYNVREVYKQPLYKQVIQKIQDYSIECHALVNLYGEFFGGNIMKGIYYGDKRIRFFGLRINGSFLSYKDFILFFSKLNFTPSLYTVPVLSYVQNLETALDFPIESIVSKFTPPLIEDSKLHSKNPKNLIEGMVICPVDYVYCDQEKYFLLKKKNAWATENIRENRPRKDIKPNIHNLKKMFEGYITEARVEGAFSKYGKRIEHMKEFNIFIPMVLNDAKEDFLKDFEEQLKTVNPNKDEMKFISNVGGHVADLLKKCL